MQTEADSCLVLPQWPAPSMVHGLTTTRYAPGACSLGRYAAFNLALHTDDNMASVQANRHHLMALVRLPSAPVWLNQLHSNTVVHADKVSLSANVDADASVTRKAGTVCAVLTADCLPVFFCNRAGSEVAVAHAGWRGLLGGILEQTVLQMYAKPADLLVWFGPAIGPAAFEVREDVRQLFYHKNRQTALAFKKTDPGHYLCNIYQLATILLKATGITAIYGDNLCTFTDAARFYSYRRDGETGRMASLIWLQPLST